MRRSRRSVALLLAFTSIACRDEGAIGPEDGSTGAASTGDGSVSTTGDESSSSTSSTSSTSSNGAADTSTEDSGETSTTGAPVDWETCLSAVEGLTGVEGTSEIDGYRYFLLEFEQPLDHGDPDGASFLQHMTLFHRDELAPLVFATNGYQLSPSPSFSEPASLLHANELRIEHRMFGESVHEDGWSTLTIEQAAADHHRIALAFGPCYEGPQIATGTSKGGMTASYFHRFYPDDVDVTVAYGAPLNYGTNDPRYVEFLDSVGDEACRSALVGVQREFLLRRAEMVIRLRQQAEVTGDTFDHLGEELVLEFMALELPFVIWQYSGTSLCDDIPIPSASDDVIWAFVAGHLAPRDDAGLAQYRSYWWQASTQLGAPAMDESGVADLLMFPGVYGPSTFVVDLEEELVFDRAAMPDIAEWVATEAQHMLFVYGGNDPWSAAAYDPGDNSEVVVLAAPGGVHFTTIEDLTAADRELALELLEAWTGVTPMARALHDEPESRNRIAVLPD